MDLKEKALAMHKEWNGKLETIAKSKVGSLTVEYQEKYLQVL